MGVEAFARHLRGRDVTVGARAQEQVAVLDDQQLLSRLGGDRWRALKLDGTRSLGNLEVLAARLRTDVMRLPPSGVARHRSSMLSARRPALGAPPASCSLTITPIPYDRARSYASPPAIPANYL